MGRSHRYPRVPASTLVQAAPVMATRPGPILSPGGAATPASRPRVWKPARRASSRKTRGSVPRRQRGESPRLLSARDGPRSIDRGCEALPPRSRREWRGDDGDCPLSTFRRWEDGSSGSSLPSRAFARLLTLATSSNPRVKGTAEKGHLWMAARNSFFSVAAKWPANSTTVRSVVAVNRGYLDKSGSLGQSISLPFPVVSLFSRGCEAKRVPRESVYLVDPASSHMLVSKIKPCKCKYELTYSETANGSLNQLWFIWLYAFTWITVAILELIHA